MGFEEKKKMARKGRGGGGGDNLREAIMLKLPL